MSQIEAQVPDVLGAQGKANIVARMLSPLQAELYEIDLVQRSNGAGDDDLGPGLQDEQGNALTYGARKNQIGALIASVLDNAEPEVVEALRQNQEQA